MDALELDNFDGGEMTPDVLPGNVDRELRKTYTAFSYLTACGHYSILWGCGSFGGDKKIKTLIQWVAASMAKATLLFVCPGVEHKGFLRDLRELID